MDRKVPVIFDTLEDLKTDPNVSGGMTVKTLGAETIGDSRGCTYKVYDATMGKTYNPNKHIPLYRTDTFAEAVKDSIIFETAENLQNQIDLINSSGVTFNPLVVERTYMNTEAMQHDLALGAGMMCKTLGDERIGDGKGRTYKIVTYDVDHGYGPNQVSLLNPNVAAELIVESLTATKATNNEASITRLNNLIDTKSLLVYNTLSDLRTDSSVIKGMNVRVLGRNTLGDGYAKTYKVYDQHSGISYDPTKDIELNPEGLFAVPIDENAEVRSEINSVASSVNSLSTRVNGVDTTISGINTSINNLSNRVTSTERDINSLGNRFDNLSGASQIIDEFGTQGVAILKLNNGQVAILVSEYNEIVQGYYNDSDGKFYVNRDTAPRVNGYYNFSDGKFYESLLPAPVTTGYYIAGEGKFYSVKITPTVVNGFYNDTDSKFYEDAEFTTEITPEENVTYIDGVSSMAYIWNGTSFEEGEASDTYADEITGEEGKTYTDNDTDTNYIWDGTSFIEGTAPEVYTFEITANLTTTYVDIATSETYVFNGYSFEAGEASDVFTIEITPSVDNIYFDKATNKRYSYNGAIYEEIVSPVIPPSPEVVTVLGYYRAWDDTFYEHKTDPSSISGYYNTEDGKFYEDEEFTTEITGASSIAYEDINSGVSYIWNGESFEEGVASETYDSPITPEEDIIYQDIDTNMKYTWNGVVFSPYIEPEPETGPVVIDNGYTVTSNNNEVTFTVDTDVVPWIMPIALRYFGYNEKVHLNDDRTYSVTASYSDVSNRVTLIVKRAPDNRVYYYA